MPFSHEACQVSAKLLTSHVEKIDPSYFGRLGENDVLSIDSSHVVRRGGDVNYLYLEVLPRLNEGVVVHIHDIFLPFEYPHRWFEEGSASSGASSTSSKRFSRSMPSLRSFSPIGYLARHHLDALMATFPTAPWWGGGSFWIRRRARP